MTTTKGDLHWINGRGYVTVDGLARMCGVSYQVMEHKIAKTKNIHPRDGYVHAGWELQGRKLILDYDAVPFIQHYAFKHKEIAQQSLANFSAIGIRAWIKQELGIEDRVLRSWGF